ncbi:MAG TPA: trigger factor [Pseudomonadales bacterium]|nr:trigger factor [Pseudomonadales bacterium]
MQVSVETVSTLERRMTVGLPAEKIDAEVDKRLERAAREARLDGFRRGKVPLKVVRQRFGQGVRQEVLGELINSAYFEAIQQEKLQPAGMPSIEAKGGDSSGRDFEFIATFEIFPELALGDFSKVSVQRLHGEVTDADIDEMLETLRQQQATFQPVERAAQSGDQVVIDYEGFKGGEAFAGGKADNSTLVLGSGQMIPGFEDGIVGMKAGESRTLALAFPDEYHSEDLKGQAVEFNITVHQVAEKQLPALDEAFFQRFGVESGSLDEFRNEVRKNMTRELKSSAMNKLKAAVIEELLKIHEVSVPNALIKNEINAMRNQMIQQFGEMAKQIDAASIFPDEMFTEQARKRVTTGLIFAEVIRQRAIKIDPERVKAKLDELASVYNNPEEVLRHYLSNKQLLSGIENTVLEEQVIDFILDAASVENKQASYQDIIRRENPAEE